MLVWWPAPHSGRQAERDFISVLPYFPKKKEGNALSLTLALNLSTPGWYAPAQIHALS